MRLSERDPKVSLVEGARCYLTFRCPCKPECDCRIAIPFTPDLEGNPAPATVFQKAWQRVSGSTFEDLTLAPSILLHASDWDGHQGWHGFLRNGVLESA